MTKSIRQKQEYLRQENAKWPKVMKEVPREAWPDGGWTRLRVWRSREFLAVLYREEHALRLSVNRSRIDNAGMWVDGITWDELQRIKNECGFADVDAVEIYPKAGDVVNVANLRHLFMPTVPINFAWRKE